jgi:hypothetical protein
MSEPTPLPPVVHRPDDERFELVLDGLTSVCEYRRVGSCVAFTHTEVPPELGGRGIAARLVETALQWARDEGLRVRPLCSYVATYLRRHPAWQDLLER